MRKRNKTIGWIVAIVVCAVLVVVALIVFLPKQEYEVKPFAAHFHPDDELDVIANMGEIPDARTAAKMAKKFWENRFGDDFDEGRGVEVYWDEAERCWLIKVAPPKPQKIEGVEEMPLYECPYVIIRENGDVLKYGVS